jgi:RING finger protein 113A
MGDAPPPSGRGRGRGRGARANLRRREASSSSDGEGGAAVAAKKPRAPPPSGALAFGGRAGASRDAIAPVRYASDRARQSGVDDLATATLETETAPDRDARAVREANLEASAAARAGGGDGAATYKGARGYTDHAAAFRREPENAKATTAAGPLRASTSARVTVRVDYAPDVCKDYRETGYCGFGDSCKFMHDRGDLAAGWKVDAEWEAGAAARDKAAAEREAEWLAKVDPEAAAAAAAAPADDGLPFACLLCKEPWGPTSDPVVTRCGHYFCEQCALRRHANPAHGGACGACGVATGGTFNVATAIMRKMEKVEREKKRGGGG